MTTLPKEVHCFVQADLLVGASDGEVDSATYLGSGWPDTVRTLHLQVRPWAPLPRSEVFAAAADGNGVLVIDAHGSRAEPAVLGGVLDLGGLAALTTNSGWQRPSLGYDMVVLGSCWALPGAAGPLAAALNRMIEKATLLVGSGDAVPFSAGAPVYQEVLEAYDRWLAKDPSSIVTLAEEVAGVVPCGWSAQIVHPDDAVGPKT